ncbi:MAG: carboxypeptidase-like regulatory protein [Bacteroidetes bacterium]|nr:carboxypeptidase-like regulatory protein [Bacteroidota bacterium]
MKLSILFLFMISLCFGQVKINGSVTDSVTKSPIPFAALGISGKNAGTLTNENGEFELTLTNKQLLDTLRIYAIGYKPDFVIIKDILSKSNQHFALQAQQTELGEVVVRSKKIKFKYLGTTDYSKNNCTGFADIEGNWKGSEAAILVRNSKNILFETFSFYVIQNKYEDSLLFRLNLYDRISPPVGSPEWMGKDWVGPTLLKKSILFKVGIKQGEFTLPIKNYNIRTSKDFFISLECLMDEMEISKFCYSGSAGVESFFKVKAFSKWHRTSGRNGKGGGGGDFNVKVSYSKD